MIRILLIVAFSCLLSSNAKSHPIKMSVGKLTIDSKAQCINVVINFYADDFGAFFCREHPVVQLDFSKPGDTELKLVSNYLQNHFSIRLNGKVVPFKLDAFLNVEDGVYTVKLVAVAVGGPAYHELVLINSLLFDAYKTQSNIVHVFYDGNHKASCRFYPHDFSQTVILN